jgi:hypothetical protein
MVLDARLFAYKQAVGLELAPEETERLERMPEDVQRAIRACRSEKSRYPRPVSIDLPKNIWGFKAVMEAITRHAGCRPTTLYVWTQDHIQGTLQRQSVWQPKEDLWPPPVQS